LGGLDGIFSKLVGNKTFFSEFIMAIQPVSIRLKDCPAYVGVPMNYFNEHFRPHLTELRHGTMMVAFLREEIDELVATMFINNGRPGKPLKGGDKLWDAKQHPGSSNEGMYGTSKKPSADQEYDKALEQVLSRRRKKS
jgi:hypothetical protein